MGIYDIVGSCPKCGVPNGGPMVKCPHCGRYDTIERRSGVERRKGTLRRSMDEAKVVHLEWIKTTMPKALGHAEDCLRSGRVSIDSGAHTGYSVTIDRRNIIDRRKRPSSKMDEQKPVCGFAFDLNALFPIIEGKHHLAISYDPEKGFAMYVDGKEVRIDYMQHFRVWDHALTEDEVSALYENEYRS